MFYNGIGSISRARGFEVVSDNHRVHKGVYIQLPQRADVRSAGYDLYCPIDITLQPGERRLIMTDVKAYMGPDEVLMIYVRSSIGIKKGVVLSNGTGIIDASYYNNAGNNGNLGVPLYNTTDKVVEFKAGERIAQGVFLKYLVADNDNVLNKERDGGFGSSGK